jgi:hypothetical protein
VSSHTTALLRRICHVVVQASSRRSRRALGAGARRLRQEGTRAGTCSGAHACCSRPLRPLPLPPASRCLPFRSARRSVRTRRSQRHPTRSRRATRSTLRSIRRDPVLHPGGQVGLYQGRKDSPGQGRHRNDQRNGPATSEFHISKPDGWPVGTYQVDVTLDASQRPRSRSRSSRRQEGAAPPAAVKSILPSPRPRLPRTLRDIDDSRAVDACAASA